MFQQTLMRQPANMAIGSNVHQILFMPLRAYSRYIDMKCTENIKNLPMITPLLFIIGNVPNALLRAKEEE
ncbi:hypothetical protein JCM19039_1605 [Geomicrobium sp. JCM 19039]|nr:hypothetical protein JCM19039_1605 [Geomicrobium sp. JCM 19039]